MATTCRTGCAPVSELKSIVDLFSEFSSNDSTHTFYVITFGAINGLAYWIMDIRLLLLRRARDSQREEDTICMG